MNKDNAILCNNISKSYQINRKKNENNFFSFFDFKKEKFYALKDVSFEIQKGECVGIIGKNGAGKSTLLKILSRITRPTKGSIILNGRLSALLEIGTGFHPELTGKENIYLNGALLGMTKNDVKNKIEEIVDFSGIEKFIDLPVKNYSSGMFVRLGFSVAAHLNSDIILLDEVLTVGDAEFQNKCKSKIKEFKKNAVTILLVSHDMNLIKAFSERTMLLDNGQMEFLGNTNDACDIYLKNTNKKFGKVINNATVKYENGILEIIVQYEFEILPNDVNLGIVLFNDNFNPITGTNISFERNYQQIQNNYKQRGRILAKSETINLVNGRYYISLWMSDLNKDIDRLDYVLSFNVNDSINVIKNTGNLRNAFEFLNLD